MIKETKEETGFAVSAERLIAVQDWRKHNVCNYVYGVVKIFVLCRMVGGAFEENIETTEIRQEPDFLLPLHLIGTPFQLSVRKILQKISLPVQDRAACG